MQATPSAPAAAGPEPMRWLRTLARLPFLAVHLGVFLPLVVLALVFPGSRHWRWNGESVHGRVIRSWSAGLLDLRLDRAVAIAPSAEELAALAANDRDPRPAGWAQS